MQDIVLKRMIPFGLLTSLILILGVTAAVAASPDELDVLASVEQGNAWADVKINGQDQRFFGVATEQFTVTWSSNNVESCHVQGRFTTTNQFFIDMGGLSGEVTGRSTTLP
ncbi:MAG: hypothetical protein AAF633_28850, partial [Chloroflexota bacterium]